MRSNKKYQAKIITKKMKIDPKERLSAVVKQNAQVAKVFENAGVDCTTESTLDKTIEQIIIDNNLDFIAVFSELDKLIETKASDNISTTTKEEIKVRTQHICNVCNKAMSRNSENLLLYDKKINKFILINLHRCSSCKNGGLYYWLLIAVCIVASLLIFYLLYSVFCSNGFRFAIMYKYALLIPLLIGAIIKWIIPLCGLKNPTSYLMIDSIKLLIDNGYIIAYIGDIKNYTGKFLITNNDVLYTLEEDKNMYKDCYSFKQGFTGAKQKIYTSDIVNKISLSAALLKAEKMTLRKS